MIKLLQFLQGKKTIGTAAVAIAYLLGCLLGWFSFDQKFLEALGFAGLAFLRTALLSHGKQIELLFELLDGPAGTQDGLFSIEDLVKQRGRPVPPADPGSNDKQP